MDFNWDPQDRPAPEFVFQYRYWGNLHHKKILKDNQIHLSAPTEFKDKNDCNFKEIQPITYGDFYNYHLNYSHKFFQNRNDDEHHKYARLLASAKLDVTGANKNFGVLCFADTCFNVEAWKVHGKDNQGFCIMYDRRKLFDSLQMHCNLWVKYEKELPTYDGRKDGLKEEIEKKFFTKLKDDFEWEQEFRMVKLFYDADKNPKRNVLFSKDCIKAVYLGTEMCNKHKSEITKLVREKYGLEPIDLSKECSKNIFL